MAVMTVPPNDKDKNLRPIPKFSRRAELAKAFAETCGFAEYEEIARFKGATLDRLEAKGLLASARTYGDGPSRRRFEMSTAGARALAETRAMRERLWHGVDVGRLLVLASG